MSFVKKKAKSTIDERMLKGLEKRDRLLVSKMELIFQISQRSKKKTIDPVFSNLVTFIENVFHQFFLEIQRIFEELVFFFGI